MGSTTGGKRKPGYLGDCTLAKIGTDYSVPISYLAYVFCKCGVPVPIDVDEQLGVQWLANKPLQYSKQSIHWILLHYKINIPTKALWKYAILLGLIREIPFQMEVIEGWSVPFGVQTMLQVEQEEELVQVLGAYT